MDYKKRLNSIKDELKPNQALLLTNPPDITYFSGFNFLVPTHREAYLIITNHKYYLIFSTFSPLPNHNILTTLPGSYPEKLMSYLQLITHEQQINEILVDEKTLFYYEYKIISQIKNLKLLTLDREKIWKLRKIKNKQEIKYMKKACKISQQAFLNIKNKIKQGMTEEDVCLMLENEMHQLGAKKQAFPTIVAFGSNSAGTHHQPTPTKLKNNMAVLMDFGTSYQNYAADMTRSFWFGDKPDSQYHQIKQIVDHSYQIGMKFIQQKIKNHETFKAKDIDDTVRDYIDQHNYKDEFIHTSGHGLGLEIHEPPSISWKNYTNITSNMTITLEPGIYLKNKFGYRYENTLLIGPESAQELTNQIK